MQACTILLATALLAQRPLDRPGGEASARLDLITRTIGDCQDRTDRFKRSLVDGQLSRNATRLAETLDRVDDTWKRERDIARTRGHVSDAIAAALQVDSDVSDNPEWLEVRAVLNTLAAQFSLPRIRWRAP